MRPIFAAIAVVICCAGLAAQEQTEKQKLLMQQAKDRLIAKNGKNISSIDPLSAEYLLKRKAGVKYVEDVLVAWNPPMFKLKGTETAEQMAFRSLLTYYEQHIPPDETPDRMIPVFVRRMELPRGVTIVEVKATAEFGSRAKQFLPALMKMQERKNLDTQTTEALFDAIAAIKSLK